MEDDLKILHDSSRWGQHQRKRGLAHCWKAHGAGHIPLCGIFFKQVRKSPEIDWYHNQGSSVAPNGIVRHRIKTNWSPQANKRTGRRTDRTTFWVRQMLWLKSMDDKFIKYESVLGKLMDLNSKESLENPWTMVPRKTHDTLENQVYWEFPWYNPWEIQWEWKNWF